MNVNSHVFLSKEEVKEKANSVFAEKGANHVSEKYSHIPTYKVIEDMALLGWKPVDVKQVKARKSIGFQKHLVIFRNNDISIDGKDGDKVFPQILLTNSSDGKNAFTFMAGLFRMICENGLVVSTENFGSIKIRHIGYDFSKLNETITSMVEKLPLTIESMNKFKRTLMEESQIVDFAVKSLTARFGENEMKRITVNYVDFVKPSRSEDAGNNLWNVFNRIQEKLIDGGFEYGFSTKVRKARTIKNFNQDIVLNSKLFDLAFPEELAKKINQEKII